MKRIFVFVAVLLTTPAFMLGQSVETFGSIRLEESTSGNTATLNPSALSTSYSLVFPSTWPSAGPTQQALIFNRNTQLLTFSPIPILDLAPQQIGYLDADGTTLRGSSQMLWDTLETKLTIASSGTGPVLSVTRSPASSSPLVTFEGGNVGVGTSTPQATLDINGDFGVRELSFTGALGVNNHNVDFGNTNKIGFVRIATNLASDINLTGLVGGRSGKMIQLYNATSRNIVIVNESANSTDTCRFKTSSVGNLSIRPRGTSTFTYSTAEQRWVMTSNVNSSTIGLTSGRHTITAGNKIVPTNLSAYMYVECNFPIPRRGYNVGLENGRVVGQIFAVEYGGTEEVLIGGNNIEQCVWHDKKADFWVWNGTKWICYGH
ncbi:MAG: hypothetical protein IPH85_05160 [Ignavibacteria bacterium]|nr:hypothetical protein [Ignavibacteria bacterium]MBK6419085.1 hypothetical protein [Ignavibacteria bacterium]MBK6760229.1 hypothetical protein [Ignavibacteria bacterium]MBK7185308.1 hypothetical protein [Ignavibacteria bacterium]MBK7411989.1 hypothetical protein [Ignavibacteria bacterium]